MRHDKGHTIGETACGVSFYNGLPVCAMRERVNRYTVIFCNKMTAQISYGNTTLEENVYLQGLRISGPSRKEAGLSNCGRRWPGAAGQGFSSL